MMLFERGILLETMLFVNYAKILHFSYILTIYEIFKSLLYLSKENENMETCIFAWFEQLKEFTQFSDTFAGQYFNKWIFSQKSRISCSVKTSTFRLTIFILPSGMKQLLEKFHFQFLQDFMFFYTWNKELVHVGKILWLST